MEKIKTWSNIITAANKLESDPSSMNKSCNEKKKENKRWLSFPELGPQ